MKVYLLAGVTVLLLAVAGFFLFTKYCPVAGDKCCVTKDCAGCTCPCTKANNVLRWVRDPNLGAYYYGWYEPDGSAFNYVATSSRNHRMGNVADTNVPAHKWVQVD